MNFNKITTGFVIQRFNPAGKFLDQEFIGDLVEFETADGVPMDSADMPLGGDESFPLTMTQKEGKPSP